MPNQTSYDTVYTMRLVDKNWQWYEWISYGFGLGFLPKAPGTYGSALGIALAFVFAKLGSLDIFSLSSAVKFICLFTVLSYISWLAIAKTEKKSGLHDDSRIVIDEVCGQILVFTLVPFTAINILLGFGLFRLFDIVKRGPVGWADKNIQGAWGTLVDDLIAGLLAAIALYLLSQII